MRDYLLFAVAPYVAVLAFVPVCVARCLTAPHPAADERQCAAGVSGAVWRGALALVALGHIAALVFPERLLSWDRHFWRMVAIEIAGVLAGSLATARVGAAFVGRIRSARRGASPMDVVAGTLALVSMASGLATAILYRWASSWSEVTLVPYLRSIVRLTPSTSLVTHLPVVVKLHVVSAFVLLVVLPFTNIPRQIAAPVLGRGRRALVPVGRLAGSMRRRLAPRLAAQAQAWSAAIFRNDAEEN